MPQLRIPALGEIVTLAEDWTFRLFFEGRNEKLIELLGRSHCPPNVLFYAEEGESWWNQPVALRSELWAKSPWLNSETGLAPNGHVRPHGGGVYTPITFRDGTKLKFDRYYIRQGGKAFDSVTFRSDCVVSSIDDPLFKARKFKSIRFWAKLEDVNTMVIA